MNSKPILAIFVPVSTYVSELFSILVIRFNKFDIFEDILCNVVAVVCVHEMKALMHQSEERMSAKCLNGCGLSHLMDEVVNEERKAFMG